MGAQQVFAKRVEVSAFQFDGSEEGAKALRDWAKERGALASFFWFRGAWNDQSPEPRVRVNGMVVQPGGWAVAGPVWQVLLAEKFAASYEVAA